MDDPTRTVRPVVGVDLGGTATRTVVVLGGEVLASQITSTPVDPSTAISVLEGAVDAVLREAGCVIDDLSGIGIGASGPIDAAGVIRNPDSLPALTGLDVVGALRARFATPVVVENDAATAAVAEFRVGAGRGSRSMLIVTLGTGVGVAVVREGVLFRGGDGLHPEGGHVTVPGERAPCYCGRLTCLEQTASRSALQRAASAVRGSGDLDDLASTAEAGDRDAIEVFDRFGQRLADGLIELSTQHRPEVVVLAGSAAAYLPHFRTALEVRLALTTSAPVPRVRATGLGDFGGAIGAALLGGPPEA
ncbi:ROK family protein [Kineococcus rhizosphaerae]|uniref:Glucokinase n=1 Tax=Kineococcus rhizosphaerae TaxID=559628 RepID=A0A2T0QXL3_9ACTN|nr:ROK family protein [Kineococcus rhizosphaerae]PRY10567.1 glucokinase [Kineococcus rhizosphaerae]